MNTEQYVPSFNKVQELRKTGSETLLVELITEMVLGRLMRDIMTGTVLDYDHIDIVELELNSIIVAPKNGGSYYSNWIPNKTGERVLKHLVALGFEVEPFRRKMVLKFGDAEFHTEAGRYYRIAAEQHAERALRLGLRAVEAKILDTCVNGETEFSVLAPGKPSLPKPLADRINSIFVQELRAAGYTVTQLKDRRVKVSWAGETKNLDNTVPSMPSHEDNLPTALQAAALTLRRRCKNPFVKVPATLSNDEKIAVDWLYRSTLRYFVAHYTEGSDVVGVRNERAEIEFPWINGAGYFAKPGSHVSLLRLFDRFNRWSNVMDVVMDKLAQDGFIETKPYAHLQWRHWFDIAATAPVGSVAQELSEQMWKHFNDKELAKKIQRMGVRAVTAACAKKDFFSFMRAGQPCHEIPQREATITRVFESFAKAHNYPLTPKGSMSYKVSIV